jgi:predicted Rdx family selenoprotein
LAARIRDVRGIKSAKLIPSGGGAFEICIDGEFIHSKLETGEWPDFGAISPQIEARVGKT